MLFFKQFFLSLVPTLAVLPAFSSFADEQPTPGYARYVIGVDIQHAPATIDDFLSRLFQNMGLRKIENTEKRANQLRESVKARKHLGAWQHGIVLNGEYPASELTKICRDFVGSIMVEANPYGAKQYKTVRLVLYDENFNRRKECVVDLKDGRAVGKDGVPLPSLLKGEEIDLGDLGKVSLLYMNESLRFDFEKPVREHLLRVPAERIKEHGPEAYLQAVSKILVTRDGEAYFPAFILQTLAKDGQLRRTRYARTAVPTKKGIFLPVEKVKFTFFRKVAPKEDPLASLVLQIQADDRELGVIMQNKTGSIDDYTNNKGLEQAYLVHETIGRRVAELGKFKAYQVISVTEMGELDSKIRFPFSVLYTARREDGKWKIYAPK